MSSKNSNDSIKDSEPMKNSREIKTEYNEHGECRY